MTHAKQGGRVLLSRIYLFHTNLAQWVRCLASLWPTPRSHTVSARQHTDPHIAQKSPGAVCPLGRLVVYWLCIGAVSLRHEPSSGATLFNPLFPSSHCLPTHVGRLNHNAKHFARCMRANFRCMHGKGCKGWSSCIPLDFGSIPTQVRNKEVHSSWGLPEISHLVSPLP